MTTPILEHKSPFEILMGREPDYLFFHVFGSACWPNSRLYNNHKLDHRSKQYVFIGYTPDNKGYFYLHPKTSRTFISKDDLFDESNFPFRQSMSLVQSSCTNSSYPSIFTPPAPIPFSPVPNIDPTSSQPSCTFLTLTCPIGPSTNSPSNMNSTLKSPTSVCGAFSYP